jgi:hypothetical protein
MKNPSDPGGVFHQSRDRESNPVPAHYEQSFRFPNISIFSQYNEIVKADLALLADQMDQIQRNWSV